eukprot:5797033-Prymnesium_polylepis.1
MGNAAGDIRSKLVAQQHQLERDEVGKWREALLTASLGSEPSSYIGKMLIAHKTAYQNALDRQRKQRHAFDQAQAEKRTALEATFRVAVWRLKMATKKR